MALLIQRTKDEMQKHFPGCQYAIVLLPSDVGWTQSVLDGKPSGWDGFLIGVNLWGGLYTTNVNGHPGYASLIGGHLYIQLFDNTAGYTTALQTAITQYNTGS